MARRDRRQKEPSSRAGWRLGGWLLSAFLICWAFVMGILVGQGVLATPEQLAWLKRVTHLAGWLDQDKAPKTEPLKDPKLSYYDRVQDRRDTQAPAPAPRTKTKPPAPAPKQPAAAPAIKPPAQKKAKAAPAPKPAPRPPAPAAAPQAAPASPKPAPPAQPPSPTAAPAPRRFAVQVASFQDKAQALNLVRSLQDKGLPAYTQIGEIQGAGRRYRVRVGPYADLDEAKGAASRLRLQHQLAAYVTRHE